MKSIFAQGVVSPEFLPQNNTGDISNIYNYIFAIVGVITVIVIIYAGIQLIISQGNSEKVAKARRAIIYGSAGLILMLLSWTIVGFFINAID